MEELIPLQQLYLMSIAVASKSLKMDCVLQDFGNDNGRLWLVAVGSTVPLGMIEFAFGKDTVDLRVITRDERVAERVIKYAEGIDGYLREFVQLFQAGRLKAA